MLFKMKININMNHPTQWKPNLFHVVLTKYKNDQTAENALTLEHQKTSHLIIKTQIPPRNNIGIFLKA